MKRPLGFLSIKTQFENAGDALINRELIRLCASHTEFFLDVSRCPEAFIESLNTEKYCPNIHTMSSIPLFLRIMVERARRKQVYYFLAPGGYVGEKSGKHIFSMLVGSALIATMSLIGVKVCHVGVSYERLGPVHTRALRFRSRFMHRTMVRDERSSLYAKELGIRIDGIAPDLSFGAADYRCNIAGQNSVAFSFRVDQAEDQRATAEQLVDICDQLLPKTIGFRFIAQVKRDLPFMRALARRGFPTGRTVTLVEAFSDVDSALDSYEGCRFVVSNRLHSLLFALIGGVEPIPLVNDSVNGKIAGVFDGLGVGVRIATNNSESIDTAFQHFESLPGEKISQILQAQLVQLQNQLASTIDDRSTG